MLGDGAARIWNLAGKLLPEATQIVDLYHAREHLHALAATLAFIVTDPAAWLVDRLADLDAGNIEAIIAAAIAAEYPLVGVKATDRDKALTYFRTNAVRSGPWDQIWTSPHNQIPATGQALYGT